MTWNNWIFKYFNSNFGKYHGRLYDNFLEKYLSTIHFWNKENNSCDLEKLDFKLFEFVAHSWARSFIYFNDRVYEAKMKGRHILPFIQTAVC